MGSKLGRVSQCSSLEKLSRQAGFQTCKMGTSSISEVCCMVHAGMRHARASRKPRHVLLSSSVDTVLGDVFADTTSTASETIAAEQRGFMDSVGRSQHSIAAQKVPQAHRPAEAPASVLAQSAARSGLLATWHVRLAQDTCLLVSLKVLSMHSVHVCLSSNAWLSRSGIPCVTARFTHISEQVQRRLCHVVGCREVL